MTMTANINVERASIAATSLAVSRVGLGTWAIGGWMWGGTEEEESVKTIHTAVERGINLIDTAPAYGFGRSEEIVGQAIAERSLRSHVVIATKTGLEWKDGRVFRNASRDRILREATDSLRRLRTDYIEYLSGPLARPAGVDRRDRRSDADTLRPGEDPRYWREQFLGCADRTISPRRQAARRAAAL
jgi:predicted oxidoreductase